MQINSVWWLTIGFAASGVAAFYPLADPLHPSTTDPADMTNDHPDAPRQFGIRLSEETMELVSAIQEFRQRTNQPTTLAAIVEDAIGVYYDRLEAEGALYGKK